MYSDLEQRIHKVFIEFTENLADTTVVEEFYKEIFPIIMEYELRFAGCIEWSAEDFISYAANSMDPFDMPYHIAQEALEGMINRHDCSLGITWDTVAYYVERYRDRCVVEDEKG